MSANIKLSQETIDRITEQCYIKIMKHIFGTSEIGGNMDIILKTIIKAEISKELKERPLILQL